jgi:hypothetical protein
MMNDPNNFNGRLELTIGGAVVGFLGGWVGGLQLMLWSQGMPPATPPRIWTWVTRWGLIIPGWGWRGYWPLGAAALAATGLAGLMWWLMTVPAERHVRGFVLHRTPQRIARLVAPHKNEPPGVRIHPDILIDQHAECRHLLIVGGAGSGKTTILWPLIQQAQARGDRMLIFDSKGDFTQKLPEPFTVLSPCDARGGRWRVGHDIRTRLDAQALAETLIKENEKDPMWSQGSRALLVGLVSDLQARTGTQWGMAHLAHATAAALGDFAVLKAVIGREDPMSLSLLGGEDAEGPNRTTMGFLVQLSAALTQVINLGVASYDLKENPEWSVRSWLAGRQPPVTILGFRDSARSLSQAFAASVIEQTVRQISDMPDAAPDQRRIWLIVDEVPRVGRVPSITDALATARSKGLRVVLGIQSLAQIREAYTRDTATTWAGQTATKILCQTTSPDDQEWCAKLLGDREVDRFQHQVSTQTGRDGGQHNQSWQRVREPVLMPAAFGRDLKVIKGRGPRALLMAGGEAAILNWPFPALITARPDRLEARWIQPNYQRPDWGKAPPDVGKPSAPMAAAPPVRKKPQNEQAQALGTPLMDSETSCPMPAVTPDAGLADSIQDLVLDHLAPGLGLLAKILGTVESVGATPFAPAQPISTQAAPLTPGSAGLDDLDKTEEGQDEGRAP